jgi:hypothetical protein
MVGEKEDGIRKWLSLEGALRLISRHATHQHYPTPLAFLFPSYFEAISRGFYVKMLIQL